LGNYTRLSRNNRSYSQYLEIFYHFASDIKCRYPYYGYFVATQPVPDPDWFYFEYRYINKSISKINYTF
jgi:hypothetical protein